MDPAAQLALVESALQTIMTSRYCALAGLAASTTDILHTFPQEVEFYWRGPWSVPRVLYFVTRYAIFINQLLLSIASIHPFSDRFCLAFVNTQYSVAVLLLWSIEGILLYRIHAVYDNLRLLVGMLVLFVITIVASAVIGLLGINHSTWIAEPLPGIHYCSATGTELLQRTYWLTWIPTLTFESLLVILALRALYVYQKNHSESSKTSLLWTLLQDSIMYYVLVVFMGIAYMITAKIAVLNGEPASSILFPIISACGVRLLYHLRIKDREMHERARNVGTTFPETAIEFQNMSRFNDLSMSELPSSVGVYSDREDVEGCDEQIGTPTTEGRSTSVVMEV